MVHNNNNMIHTERMTAYKNLRRRTEDIDYWRKRAGWFDDDVSMKEFNQGVSDTYYNLDDDGAAHRGKSASTASRGRVSSGSQGLNTFLKIGAAVVAVAFAILLFRALSRRTSKKKVGTSKSSFSVKNSRSRSRSRARSSSRSRRATTPSTNYELMDEKSDTRSRKSSRSRSRSRRSSSKNRKSRSRSKSRAPKEVLV